MTEWDDHLYNTKSPDYQVTPSGQWRTQPPARGLLWAGLAGAAAGVLFAVALRWIVAGWQALLAHFYP